MSTLAELFSDHRFRISASGRQIQERVKREFGFTELWQAARLAIAISLEELDEPAPPTDRDAPEMRGNTLFKADGPATASLIVMRAGRALGVDQIAHLIEAHWDRGLSLLEGMLTEAYAADQNADDLLMQLVERSLLGGKKKPELNAGDPRAVLDAKIVAQSSAKEIIVPLLKDALVANPRLLKASLLFTGPASTGKTLFSQTIAEILDLPFVDANGTVLRVIEDLLERIKKACWEKDSKAPSQTGTNGGLPIYQYPPAVVFIDECHKLSKLMQTELLTALEPDSRTAKTNDFMADLSQVTFLLATTDSNELIDPLKTRTRGIRLDEYNRDQVAEMVSRLHPRWPAPVHLSLAVAGRLIPRRAKQEAEDFERFMRQEQKDKRPSEALALEFMRKRGMDSLGLTNTDYAYLGVLPESKDAIGLQQIASQLRVEKDEVEEEIEPYLVQLRFVERGQRGRSITDDGLERLHQHLQSGGQS